VPGNVFEIEVFDTLAVEVNFVIIRKAFQTLGDASLRSVPLVDEGRDNRDPGSRHGGGAALRTDLHDFRMLTGRPDVHARHWFTFRCSGNRSVDKRNYLRPVASCQRAIPRACFGTGIGCGMSASLGKRYSTPINSHK
jgi:hypothetical protein